VSALARRISFHRTADVNPADAGAESVGVDVLNDSPYVAAGTRSCGVCACQRRSNKACGDEHWCRDSLQGSNFHRAHLGQKGATFSTLTNMPVTGAVVGEAGAAVLSDDQTTAKK
jgi:hypothetical protein